MTDDDIAKMVEQVQKEVREHIDSTKGYLPTLTYQVDAYQFNRRLVRAVLRDQDYKAKLGQVVIDFIDRMNDYETAEEGNLLLQHFLGNVEPILEEEFERRRSKTDTTGEQK